MGNYDFTWAEPSGGWGCPDLSDPANAITDTLAFVDDGTAGDSLGCNALVNGTDITGKIAVIYRGACEFGTKALNAENAGAVGAIIVNNVPRCASWNGTRYRRCKRNYSFDYDFSS